MVTRLRIAVQSKGRLAEGGMDLLKNCGLRFAYGRDKLHQSAENMPVDLMLVRDDDIPNFVASGACDYGIVGENVFREEQLGSRRGKELEIALRLGFSKCTLKLAAPKGGAITSVADLDGKAVATSYPAITADYLERNGVKAEIVEMHGSVEVAPRLNIADAICDLVSSGATLEANGLAAFETVLVSEAVLVRRKESRSGEADAIAEILMRRAQGVIASAQTKYIMLNAPTDRLDAIKALLPGSDAPTVAQIAGRDDVVALHAVCRERVFWETLEALEAEGARAILVLPIEKMLA
ncbi:ATP phosphoribosyltransferase [Maricaulis sp.]|uniref:ATP phosphoribosyltransferase n=1 Tax=Maricaulis sp. TaxID=1486257 RepID=UPI001B0CFFE2|nr:ATP phosphoribosyltransferase [Maricaulis sp.]MBO6876420.1 ATP phosphoribosyltransferase [Maricaulis sp.]